MTLRTILAAASLLLPLWASAHNIEKGQRVPPVGIADRGELILDNDKFSYKARNSAQLAGKVRVVQHIAGRTSAKRKMPTGGGHQGGKIPTRSLPDHHDREYR